MKQVLLAVLMLLPMMASPQATQAQRITLNNRNSVIVRGEINIGSMMRAQLQLAFQVIRRANKTYPIYLVLDSPGGSVPAGNMFIQFAKTLSNVNTITIFSASMAAGIVESLPGKRYITDGGMLMFHRAYAGVEGQVEVGELETRLDMIKSEIRHMEMVNASRMGLTLEQYKQKIVNELWLRSDEAVSGKAADAVVDIVCSQDMVQSAEDVIMEAFFGVVKFKFSRCPLFRAPLGASDDRVKWKIPTI